MKTLIILISCLFISFNSTGQVYIAKYDTIREVKLLNQNFQRSYTILDIKDIDKYLRKILLKDGVSIVTLCNLQQENYSGFAVNWIKENKNGFEISVEYGSRVYFHKIFYFVYKKQNFYLCKIVVNRFDRYKPEKSAIRSVILKRPVCVDKFDLVNYLTN